MRSSQKAKAVMGSEDSEKDAKPGEGLPRSVGELDEQTLEDARLISDALNQSISSFVPDMLFKNLVKDYKAAVKIYGQSMIRRITGENPSTVRKNIKIPEYQRELKKKIDEHVERLKDNKLIDKKFNLSKYASELAGIVMFMDELDKLKTLGIGEKTQKKLSVYGEKDEIKTFSKGDRYRDISVHKTVRTAIRRKRILPEIQDIKVFSRCRKGKIFMIYALDASGSMKGEKIGNCKKAGIALSYKAITNQDKVGLLVFKSRTEKKILPSTDFDSLLKEIMTVQAYGETDIAGSIREAVHMFPRDDVTKHLVLITDAMPTTGDNPKKDTLEYASIAKSRGITISIIGISLKKTGKTLAEEIVRIGGGKLYVVKDSTGIDEIVLEEYDRVAGF